MKITKTTIKVSDIEIFAHHGVMDQERQVGNEFKVSVALTYDAKSAMEYDDVAEAVNYAEVVEAVKGVMSEPSNLIEHVGYRLIKSLLEAFPTVESGSMQITKVHPPLHTSTGGATFSAEFTR